jgi:hypothetical protein
MNNQFAKLFNVLNHQVLVTKNNGTQGDKFVFNVRSHTGNKEFKLTFACDTIKDLNQEFNLFDQAKAELFFELFTKQLYTNEI